jgi:hypothetical protein
MPDSKPNYAAVHEKKDRPTYANDRLDDGGMKVDSLLYGIVSPRRKNCSLGQSSIDRASG